MTRTRSHYGDGWSLRIACPCCVRELVAVIDYDDDAEPCVTLEPVPLRDRPCSGPRWLSRELWALFCQPIGYPEERPAYRGSECNWLCNVASHVTTVTPVGVTRLHDSRQYGSVEAFEMAVGALFALARCVHHSSA